jgi:hypothetical protein
MNGHQSRKAWVNASLHRIRFETTNWQSDNLENDRCLANGYKRSTLGSLFSWDEMF